MASTDEPPGSLRVHRASLVEAIHQAFVESRFSDPPQPKYVTIHADGKVFVSRSALHMSAQGFSVLAVECFGSPDVPANAMPTNAPWSREEFQEWVRSRNDLYLEPALDELNHQAAKKGLRITLLDR